MVMVVALTSAATAFAQSSTTGSGSGQSSTQQSGGATTSSANADTRPATTTVNGDTGLWFVPTGEVVPAKKSAISAYRVNFDRDQGFTDVSDWPVTFAFGAGDRAEIFGAWTLVRRIDRDVRPLFISDQTTAGGLVNEHPFVRQGWSGNQLATCGCRDQPDVAVEAAAGGARAARDDRLPTAKPKRGSEPGSWTLRSTRSSKEVNSA
jgi:hypothetical protein